MTHEEAAEIIRTRRGVMYDPTVVDAFIVMDRVPDVHAIDPPPLTLRRAQDPVAHSTAANVLPEFQSATPRRAPSELRLRATQFLRKVAGSQWHDAGHAVAAFVPSVVPDAIAALFRFDSAAHEIVVAGMDRTFDGRIPTALRVGRGVSGWVAANRRPIVNADAELDLGDIAGIVRPPLRMCISVPLLTGAGELRGVLTVYSPYAFSETDRILIDYIADGLATAFNEDEEDEPAQPQHVAG
jgi:GAF domain-containing protein